MKVFDIFGALPARKRRMDDMLMSNPRGLSGLSEDYATNVNNFKGILAKLNDKARAMEAHAHAGEEVYHPPQTPEYNPPPTPTEGAIGPEMNTPPLAPPITVHGGNDEEEEGSLPTLVPPKTPGGHAPVVTGVPNWNDKYSPPVLQPLPPEPETSACGPGYSRTVPGGPCVKNTPTEENYGYACYTCPDGSTKFTKTPGPGCTANGASEADCKPQTPTLPNPLKPWLTSPPAMPNITSPVTTGAGTFAGGEPLDTGAATFAGGGLLSGTVRLRRSHDLGAPAFSRPIRMARRPW